jgi:hypothetical protein
MALSRDPAFGKLRHRYAVLFGSVLTSHVLRYWFLSSVRFYRKSVNRSDGRTRRAGRKVIYMYVFMSGEDFDVKKMPK